jgi:hypothetical protein
MHRPHDLDTQICSLAGDRETKIVLVAGRITVGGARELQRHHRPPARDAQDVAAMVAPRHFRARPDQEFDARIA